MRRRFREMALSAVALSVLLSAGCGPSTTNEENIDKTKAPGNSGGPGVKNYGEFAKKQAEKEAQARKEAQEAKKASKAKPKTP
jgi:hypothetical protein